MGMRVCTKFLLRSGGVYAVLLCFLMGLYFFTPQEPDLLKVGDLTRDGIFFTGSLLTIFFIVFLFVAAYWHVFMDFLVARGHEIGIDVEEVGREYQDMLKDDVLSLIHTKDEDKDDFTKK